MKKYELTNESLHMEGDTVLHRIKALRSFGKVKVGDLGGFIEKEENLSHSGVCWVFDNAQVLGNARVSDNAEICGIAKIYDDAQVFGGAKVFDSAEVFGWAQVYDDVRVFGHTKVYDYAEMNGHARIFGYARAFNNTKVFGNVWVFGNAIVFDFTRVFGEARVYGNAQVPGINIVEGRTRIYDSAKVFDSLEMDYEVELERWQWDGDPHYPEMITSGSIGLPNNGDFMILFDVGRERCAFMFYRKDGKVYVSVEGEEITLEEFELRSSGNEEATTAIELAKEAFGLSKQVWKMNKF